MGRIAIRNTPDENCVLVCSISSYHIPQNLDDTANRVDTSSVACALFKINVILLLVFF